MRLDAKDDELAQRFKKLPRDLQFRVEQQINHDHILRERIDNHKGQFLMEHYMIVEGFIQEEEQELYLRRHSTMTDDYMADSEVAELRLSADPVLMR